MLCFAQKKYDKDELFKRHGFIKSSVDITYSLGFGHWTLVFVVCVYLMKTPDCMCF